MRVVFNIDYFSSCELVKIIAINNGLTCEFALTSIDMVKWSLSKEVGSDFKYRYKVGSRIESGDWRTLSCVGEQVFVYDSFRDAPKRRELCSSFFKEFVYSHEVNTVSGQIVLKVKCGFVKPTQVLSIVGSCESLGQWNVKYSKHLSYIGNGFWAIGLSFKDVKLGDQFKFILQDKENAENVVWENGENRIWHYNITTLDGLQLSDLEINIDADYSRFAGVAIPVFSLRSDNSVGIGDFDDLARFALWASKTGCKVVQILPINDTTNLHTYKDSYPYNAISTIALHPLYLSIEKMGALEDVDLAHFIADQQQKLNSYDELDYEAVEKVKSLFFRAIYAQDGAQTIESEEFKRFYKSNADWLAPYSLFCHLRDINNSSDYTTWGVWSQYNKELADRIISTQGADREKIMYYAFLQFHLDKQLAEVRKIAKSVGVALKGDIAIGVCRNSVEAWTQPHLFNLDKQAGAPPDDFAEGGQNWGFPTYNWDAMAKEDFSWWKRRLTMMSKYFDLYRIDHILGFFRIWQIPQESIDGLKGQFSPALPYSYDELDGWGFVMQEQFYKPVFNKNIVAKVLGRNFSRYKDFLQPIEKDLFEFKEEFNSQKKIDKLLDDEQIELKKSLFSLINECLFVVDDNDNTKFHPRIDAQKTFLYDTLDEYQKWRFNELYTHFFYHRHNDFWAKGALSKLPILINSTDMLCCAEDLGMVPDSVAGTLSELQVLTLEVERMPKRAGETFANVYNYPYLSVCTTSTHDMSPLRLFWLEGLENGLTQRYYNEVLHRDGEADKVAQPNICRQIIKQTFDSGAMLAILPLQDLFGISHNTANRNPQEERINIPSDPNHYWQYRMQFTVEELEELDSFCNCLRRLISTSGR